MDVLLALAPHMTHCQKAPWSASVAAIPWARFSAVRRR